MNWVQVEDEDGITHLVNLAYVVKITEVTHYRISESDVATPLKPTVRIYLRQGLPIHVNLTLDEMKELIYD